VERVVHVRDEGDGLEREVRGALEGCDVVVMTGGVSMGHRDPVRGVVERVGAEVVFHGLPQRPGKPMLGAVVERGVMGARAVAVFGLPGNPVSAMVTARRIVVPVMAARAGMAGVREPVVAEIANGDGKSLELWWHRLARVGVDGRVELVDTRGSGDIVSCGRAEGFVEMAPGDAAARARFYAWDGV
jgi:molybdopterin biosynthesis enzyme